MKWKTNENFPERFTKFEFNKKYKLMVIKMIIIMLSTAYKI